MESVYGQIISELGFNSLVCDIFPQWEDVKDEILTPDRKVGSGNGTIHIFLGAADSELRKEFPQYYDAVEKGEDPAVGAIPITHYFLSNNVISMLGYVCQYCNSNELSLDAEITPMLTQLNSVAGKKEILSTTSLFKISTGAEKLRPYFKQFDSNGVFSKLIRKILLPNSSYKISLYKNDKNEYAAFWLIGFDWLSNFEATPQKKLLNQEIVAPKEQTAFQQIFYGAPGTGKSNEIKQLTGEGKDGVKFDKDFTFRITFHPDSDYASFVGAYKPVCADNKIIYTFRPQAFLKAYIAAWTHPDKNVALVVEEINRGNCAQIFGDIFQLLDREESGLSKYPIESDIDMNNYLKNEFNGKIDEKDKDAINAYYVNCYDDAFEKIKNGDILTLPKNLSILATMNTSDQSLFPMDSAFKRRWEWVYQPIEEGKDENGGALNWKIELNGYKPIDWWDFINCINHEIADLTSSEDKQLGYFFCTPNKDKIISSERFVNKVIFYLWNDVFKDYAFDRECCKDENGNIVYYKQFFKKDSNEINPEVVAKFLNKLKDSNGNNLELAQKDN